MDLGFSGEMIFLALLGLILFGPRKLPEIARKAGRLVDDLKRASSEFQVQLHREVGDLEALDPARNDPSKNFLTALIDDIKALNSVTEPAKANTTVPEPAQPKQPVGETLLIDNVNRIKELLAKNGTTAETTEATPPPRPGN
jgi:Sec-independent protein translocase protein TatA